MSVKVSAPTIDIGYCGVHQAFQCALAAHEAGWLKTFYCSVYDAPGKWGGVASRILGKEVLRNRRIEGLDENLVREHPGPWIVDSLCRRFGAQAESMRMFEAFDAYCAGQLERNPPSLFISTERCALKSLQVAARTGVKTVHDCPQLHPVALESLMRQAADACSLEWEGFPDGVEMKARKLQEYELAERLIVYSEFHRESFVKQGIAPEKLLQVPLWVDTDFWHPVAISRRPKNSRGLLHLLFVGEYSLRKGLPFLFQALKLLKAPVRLTLVGKPSSQTTIPSRIGTVEIIAKGALTKLQLRELYAENDLLVLPSTADSFGFVALEAMACGIPVILSENCGVPVPDPSWRVPALDSHALAARIQHYLTDPLKVSEDAALCRSFATQFTPKRFREQMQDILRAMLLKVY